MKRYYSIRLKLVAVEDGEAWDWIADTTFKVLDAEGDYRNKEVELLEAGIECLKQELERAKADRQTREWPRE